MSKEKHIHHYTATDIRRYLEGKMLPAEMHALEQAALEDAFLSDAIDGMKHMMDVHGPTAFEKDVDDLKKRLESKSRRSAGIWWKAAAILAVVCTGIALTYILQDRTESGKIVKTEPQIKKAVRIDTARASATTSIETDTTVTQKEEAKKVVRRTARPGNSVAEPNKDGEAVLVPPAVSSVEPSKAERVEDVVSAHPDTTPQVDQTLQGRAAGIEVRKTRSASRPHVDTVHMDEAQLNEIVVTGYGATNAESTEEVVKNTSSRRFAPEGGWDAFHRYISINKKIPVMSDIERLSFRLDETGKPIDIKIVRSISPEVDEEAIRLLTNGPSWKILRGKNRRLFIEIRF